MIDKASYKLVSLAFSNQFGADPKRLPFPGQMTILGVKPASYAGDGTRYMLSDGSIWEYKGVSTKCDERFRVNGWEQIQ